MNELLASSNVWQVAVSASCVILSIGIALYLAGLGFRGKRLEDKDDARDDS